MVLYGNMLEIYLGDVQCAILKLFSGFVGKLCKRSVVLSSRTQWSWKNHSY